MKSAYALTTLALLVSYGCKGPTTPSGTTGTFSGTFATIQGLNGTIQGPIGTMTVSLQGIVASAPAPFRVPLVAALHAQSSSATGSLVLVGGDTVPLSGTYADSSKALSLSGGGYTMSGTLADSRVTGTLNGPAGTTGAFGTMSTSLGPMTVYCVSQQTPSGEKVAWNVGASSTDIEGTFTVTPPPGGGGAAGATGGYGNIKGTVTGTMFRAAWVVNSPGPFKGDAGYTEGTIKDGVMSGVGADGKPYSGGKCPT